MGGQYLVFWGATGIATSAVDAGTQVGDAAAGADAMTLEDAASGGGSSSSGSSSGGSSGGSSSGSSSMEPGDAANGTTDGALLEAESPESKGCLCSDTRLRRAPGAPSVLLAACAAAVHRRRTRKGAQGSPVRLLGEPERLGDPPHRL